MTPDGFAGERAVPDPAGHESTSDGASASLPPSVILSICDRLLREVGRRRHVFGWLRAPDAASEQWLPVDAYYPGKRLVVMCQSSPSRYDDLYRRAIPQHGFRLLEISPAELGTDRMSVERALSRRLSALAPSPPPQSSPPPRTRMTPARRPRTERERTERGRTERGRTERERTKRATDPAPPRLPRRLADGGLAKVLSSLAAPSAHAGTRRPRPGTAQSEAALRAARFVAAHGTQAMRKPLPMQPPLARSMPPVAVPSGPSLRPSRPAPARPPSARASGPALPRAGAATAKVQSVGVVLLIALAAIVAVELYGGVVEVALGNGHVLLAFGLALDTGARALAAIGAARAGAGGWAWAYAIGGTPVVAASPLTRRSAPVSVDPAPLGVLLSLLAAVVLATALVALLLGG